MTTSTCEGHPAGPFDPMGKTVYCDGSCQRDGEPDPHQPKRTVRFGVGRTFKEAAESIGATYTPPKRRPRIKGNCQNCPAKNVILRESAMMDNLDGSSMLICSGCRHEGY
jgi:hypothetical protein